MFALHDAFYLKSFNIEEKWDWPRKYKIISQVQPHYDRKTTKFFSTKEH